GDGVDAGLGPRFGDDQAAARSAAHLRDRVIFEQPHRLPQRRAAHPVALQQRRLGPEDRTDLPATGGDIVADGGCQHLSEFAVGWLIVEPPLPAWPAYPAAPAF